MKQEQRTYLAQYFTDRAGWHSRSHRDGADGPDANREKPASIYASLADHIQSLDENDLRLVALARLTDFDEVSGFSPGPCLSAAIADVGQFIEEEPDPFLDHLVHAALDDRLSAEHAPADPLPILEIEQVAAQPAIFEPSPTTVRQSSG
ncbi:MAG: hypothetical protein R3A46_18055 [Thermomicrobiales bacterium]